ncbi:coiled-coil domain-containing protein 81-like [Grus americana]|nr:coiled-coil domain-containing protein 81-like [Grus americana]
MHHVLLRSSSVDPGVVKEGDAGRLAVADSEHGMPFLSFPEICKVWASTSRHIRRQLLQKRAVDIGVGTFALVPAHAMVGEDKVLPVERPVFQPCRLLRKFYKLKCAKSKIPDETPFVQLDFEHIAADIHFRREIVERCIHETLLFFAGALRDNKEVEFSFKGLGILAVRRKVVSMTFSDDCLLELDPTGNMLEALLGDSKMMSIVAFAGKNNFSRLSRDGVITLPRLALEIPHQGDPATSLKPRRESAPWGGGARRVSVLDPVFLAQRRVSLARQQAKATKAGQARFLPVVHKAQEELKQPKPPAQPRLKLPACAPQPSVTGTSSLRTERAEKRLRLLMASKRQEVEEEAWRQYHADRTRQNMGRGQV